VIPHLLEQSIKDGKTFDMALQSLPGALKGSYAILIAKRGADELYLMRRGSPLVIGVGDGEYFPASDIPSFLPFVSKVLYISEGEILVLSRQGIDEITLIDGATRRVKYPKVAEVIDLKRSAVSKGDFDYFMVKEVMEQVDTIDKECRENATVIHDAAKFLDEPCYLWLVGAGSSYHACLYGELILGNVANRKVQACVSSEFEFHEGLLGKDSVLIALSQSGETADTIDAATFAKAKGAKLITITNEPLSKLAKMADFVIPLNSGKELSVAATKSYTSQLAIFTLLAYELRNDQASGRLALLQARDTLFDLTSRAARQHVLGIANKVLGCKDIFLLGRGLNRVTALEGSLKVKEVADIRAEAFPAGEMKHGPLALIHEGTPVFILYDEKQMARAELTASELRSRGAVIYSLGPHPLNAAADHIRVADAGVATPIVQIVPLQLLAYELALLRNLDPDHPRNLAKCVTVN
jgi:glucosamine--fructose-6-phosphate aminotransferase (isomerizing)